MKELFQIVIMRLALCGLAASFALLVLRSRLIRDTFTSLLFSWRTLTVLGRVAVCSFLLIGVLAGGDKTNALPQNMTLPLSQTLEGRMENEKMEMGKVGGRALRENSISNSALSIVDMTSFAVRWASNWNVCGAWKDSFWLPFDDGWVFPHGTNHLSGVEVVSYGEVWATPFGDAVASLGAPVEIVPGLSAFCYEHTPSNSYRFVWTNAAINRDTNNLVTASIELFRDGGVCVTINGVAAYLPRELPFDHHGFGQDDEWVVANFTNATEILSVGYPQWVDAQVGTDLTNGLYKLTVNVADDPPETTQISVGDLSIAVTNAGEYVFLLGKGIRYDLSASSDCATNFVYSAVDDLGRRSRLAAGGLRLQAEESQEGMWSSDSGELRMFWPFEFVEWKPLLTISPRKWNPSRANSVRSFTATLADIPGFVSPSYEWSSADSSVCTCEGATERTATFTCRFPAAYGSGVSLGLDVILDRTTLHAAYWRYIGYFSESEDYEESIDDCGDCEPTPGLVVGASPSVVFFEKGTANPASAEVGCFYQVSEAGTFELTVSGDAVSLTDQTGASVSSGYTWETEGGVVGARHFFTERVAKSTSPSGTVFTVVFTPDTSTNTLSGADTVTFVEWETVTFVQLPAPRNRRSVGIGEWVYVELDPVPLGMYVSELNSGGRVIQSTGFANRWNYRAPYAECLDILEFAVADTRLEVPFEVLEPDGYEASPITVHYDPTPGIAGAFDMVFDLQLTPTNVSFNALDIIEQGMVSTNAVGYFLDSSRTNWLDHAQWGADKWNAVAASMQDTVRIGECPPPWGSGGSFSWPVPNHWGAHNTHVPSGYFCNTDQAFEIDANGTTRIRKFGYVGECTTNRVVTIHKEMQP